MRITRRAVVCIPLGALVLSAIGSAAGQPPPTDPFELVGHLTGSPVLVPPRALSVIPERHTNRAIRVVDVLTGIEPQFDDIARGAGLSPERAIQLRTQEANVPIFVAKNESSVSTVLQLPLGASIEVQGLLIERGGRYLFLAAEVRPSPPRRPR